MSILRMARKEFTEMTRDGRFRVAAGLVFLLLGAALLMGWRQAATISRERAAAQQVSRAQWLSIENMNPHSAAHYSIFAFKPAPPLSLADTGVTPYAGIAVWLEAHRQNELDYSAARDTTSAGRFGQLTAAAVLQILIPLVIVLLAFAAFTGEREQGTLRQMLALGLLRRQLALGKSFGVALALGLLLVPAALIGAAALMLSGETLSFTATAPRLALLMTIYLAYFAAFLFVALAVSALAPSSRAALIVLLAFWSVNLILPRVAADAAKTAYPTMTALEFQAAVEREMREGIDGHNPYDARGEHLKQKLLAEYNVKTVDELPINFDGVALQAGEDYGSRIYDRHYGALWTAYQRQNRIHTLAGAIAPLAAVRSVSMSLAGSDWNHHRHFAESAEAYRRMLVRQMNDEVTYHSISRDYEKNVRSGAEFYGQVPDFRYQPPSLGWAVGGQRLALGLLCAWLVGSAFALIWALRKMRVDAKEG